MRIMYVTCHPEDIANEPAINFVVDAGCYGTGCCVDSSSIHNNYSVASTQSVCPIRPNPLSGTLTLGGFLSCPARSQLHGPHHTVATSEATRAWVHGTPLTHVALVPAGCVCLCACKRHTLTRGSFAGAAVQLKPGHASKPR